MDNEPILPAIIANRKSLSVTQKQENETINGGNSILPPTQAVRGQFGSFSAVYANPDKGYQESVKNAQAMENSLLIRECLESRMRYVSLQDFDIELLNVSEFTSEQKDQFGEINKINPNKVNQVIGTEELQKKMKLIKHIENHRQHRLYCLMNAIWFGRYGVENQFGSQYVEGIGTVKNVIKKWVPKHGDKYIFRFDDGRHEVEEGQVGVRVGLHSSAGRQQSYTDWQGKNQSKHIATPYGYAYILDPIEREATTIHKHIVEDGIFEDPRSTGSIYGVGIRSRVYWTWWQMQETIKIMMNYLERTGLGIEIWKFRANDPHGKAAVEKMMKERQSSGYSAFLVPVQGGDDAQLFMPEIIEPGPGGVSEMNQIITERFHDEIKRYILGQKLTSEADATGLGGNLADIHLATYQDIVKFDTQNLEHTETDTLRIQQRKNFPGSEGIFLNYKLKSQSGEMAERLDAMKTALDMGFNVSRESLGDVIGMAEASEGDGLLDSPFAQSRQQQSPFQPGDQSPMNQSTFPPNIAPPQQQQFDADELVKARYGDDKNHVQRILGAIPQTLST